MIKAYEERLGTITVRWQGNPCRIQIRRGNCLAVLLSVTKNPESTSKEDRYNYGLFMFYHDEQHIINMINNGKGLLDEEIVSMQLNMYYKESWTLLKYFTQEGNKVTCYYKEPKKKK